MGSIHFIGGEKGGVGKSFVSRLLAQYFIDTRVPVLGFDSDQSHGTFSRFYGEYTSPVVVSDYDSMDRLLEAADENPNHALIIDLAAQTSAALADWMASCDALTVFGELNYEIYLWHVMDDGVDSANLLKGLLTSYPQATVRFVVVQNQGRGDDFSTFQQTATYAKAQTRNTQFITLSKLDPKLAQKIDFNSFSFWAAANNKTDMTIGERRRVSTWLKDAYQQFDTFLAQTEPAPAVD